MITVRWYIYDDLKTDEDIAGYLGVVIAENDPEHLADAINVAERAIQINADAKKPGVKRRNLYKAECDAEDSAATPAKKRKKNAAARNTTDLVSEAIGIINKLGYKISVNITPCETGEKNERKRAA